MGMAISTDLKRWQYRGIALAPLPEHHWESGRIMAGSLYKENGTYFFFYSAAPAEAILQEAIGLATSSDGLHWQRRSQPFLTLDTRFYSSGYFFKDVTITHQQWRDPFIFKDPRTNKYYLFFTTSSRILKPPFNGCVGVAVSDRIDGTYEVLPPIVLPRIPETDEGIFNEMERPQVIYRHGKYHLFFSAAPSHMNPRWIERVGREELTFSSLYWFACDRVTGPYEPMGEKPVVKGSDRTNLYGTSLIQGKDGNFFAVGSYYKSQTLAVSAHIPVVWEEDTLEIRLNFP
jgi:beta-fructofuranosidase